MGSLMFPAVLLVLLYTMVVQITEEAIQMGIFPEAADYSFQNCRKEMLEMVTKSGGLLQTELNNNPDFKTMWKGNAEYSKTIPGGTPEHMAALKNYAEAGSEFHGKFTKLLQKSRGRDEFPFKSLFFLLADAMQLIREKKCRTVYSGTEQEYITKIGEKVRIRFFPAKLLYTEATEDTSSSDNAGTVFNITSCSVIRLEDYGFMDGLSEDIDLLISPTEVFTVTGIRTVSTSNDAYNEIALTHSHFNSYSNCSSLVSLPEESKESSSSFLSSSLLNLMACFFMLYYYKLTL